MNRLVLATCCFCLVMVSAVTARSEALITASHNLIGTASGTGGAVLTIELTLTNSGTTSLSNLDVVGIGMMTPIDPVAGALYLPSLAAGQTLVVIWDIQTDRSGGQLFPGMALPTELTITATDELGNLVNFTVASK